MTYRPATEDLPDPFENGRLRYADSRHEFALFREAFPRKIEEFG